MTKKREGQLWDSSFVKTITSLAPGTQLREGLENVLRAKMGALVVVADYHSIVGLVDGGFALNCDFTPARFYELAKMDGALVLSGDTKRILFANAQLVPDANISTSQTGTRHRTAERMARQTGALVIAISQRRNVITLYLGHESYTLRDINVILYRANQALQTLERYRQVLAKGIMALNALEFQDQVTLKDVAYVLIKAEQVHRIVREIERHIIELGREGNLICMQMEELLPEEDEEMLLIRDYCIHGDRQGQEDVREQLFKMPEESLDPITVCQLLGYGSGPNVLEIPVVPRGYRILRRVPRLPMNVIENLVNRFKTLPPIYNATLQDLDHVDGIGETRARSIKEGLKKVRETIMVRQ